MEETKKKRGWVKDAVIVFLAVLLILTFFSNTILNRSLPEVATAYVMDGTIVSQVRGNGTVQARENYEVILEQTRKVLSVPVSVGQEVHAGDVLFTLQAGDSSELAAARETLSNMQRQYERALINASSSDYAREERDIQRARENLQEAQAARDELALTDAYLKDYEKKLADAEAKVAALETELKERKAATDAADKKVDDQNAVIKALKKSLKNPQAVVREKEAAVTEQQRLYEAAQMTVNDWREAVSDAQMELSSAIAERDALRGTGSAADALAAAEAELSAAREALRQAETERKTAEVLYGADYAALLAEAESMIDAAYPADHAEACAAAEAAAEADYRAELGIGSGDALTPEQSTELDTRKAEAVAALPTLEEYRIQQMPVYLPAAATMNAGNAKGEAYGEILAADAVVNAAQSRVAAAQSAVTSAEAEAQAEAAGGTAYAQAQAAVTRARNALDSCEYNYSAAQAAESSALRKLNTAQAALNDARDALSAAEDAISEDAQDLLQEYTEDLNDAQILEAETDAALEEAKAAVQELKRERENRENEYKAAGQTAEQLQDTLEDMLFNLEQQRKSDGRSQQLEALDRREMLESIQKQEELIASLSSEDGGTEVIAKVSGKIQSISVSAGRDAQAGSTLAVIEVPDLGYTLSFSVTNEQARLLRTGDTCSVSNYYWGSRIDAVLTAIKTDPQNPQTMKLLTFDVTGDVTAGSTLSLTVGARNANYDLVVPNSAIRSDVNGSFLLVVTAKNSPLGNRYYAKRVNVEIIASDDTWTAVSGGVNAYDSVITTASGSAPIAAGDQVRLADTDNG